MSKKKYRPISVHFDPTDKSDKKILDWLDQNKSKTSSYSALIRKALMEYMKKQGSS